MKILFCCIMGGGVLRMSTVVAFQAMGRRNTEWFTSPTALAAGRRRTLVKEKTFDPLDLSDDAFPNNMRLLQYDFDDDDDHDDHEYDDTMDTTTTTTTTYQTGIASTTMAAMALTSMAGTAVAKTNGMLSQGNLDPSTFQPVCPASDGFYRFLQSSTETVVGSESFVEYGPLIAGGLLRVRLELCVVESFFQEAIVPFVAKNGLNWVLPLHETVETFLAGTIFALALTFILIGSTKLVNVVVFFTDLILGGPARLFGGFFYDRALGRPVTLDVGVGPFKTRVIGPPDDENKETTKTGIMERGASTIVVVALSGIVKYAGEFLKVGSHLSKCPCVIRTFHHHIPHRFSLLSPYLSCSLSHTHPSSLGFNEDCASNI